MKTTNRLEKKYLISYRDYCKIKPMVQALLSHDKHGEHESYLVSSVYLDDLVRNGAQDKAFGNEIHKKYRLRHYNDDTILKLELKYKEGEYSKKSSLTISKELYQAILEQDFDVLESHFDDPLIRRFTLDMLRNHLLPICYISYQREAYRDELDNCRITFDHDLTVERYLGDEHHIKQPLLLDTMLILEIKYEHYIPKVLQDIFKQIQINQISYSKYFMGYSSMEL